MTDLEKRLEEPGLREGTVREINTALAEYAEGGVRTSEWATLCDKVELALAHPAADALREALDKVHDIATRSLSESNKEDTKALVDICTVIEAATFPGKLESVASIEAQEAKMREAISGLPYADDDPTSPEEAKATGIPIEALHDPTATITYSPIKPEVACGGEEEK